AKNWLAGRLTRRLQHRAQATVCSTAFRRKEPTIEQTFESALLTQAPRFFNDLGKVSAADGRKSNQHPARVWDIMIGDVKRFGVRMHAHLAFAFVNADHYRVTCFFEPNEELSRYLECWGSIGFAFLRARQRGSNLAHVVPSEGSSLASTCEL